MLADGVPAGHSRCDSRANGAGLALEFEGAVGAPRPLPGRGRRGLRWTPPVAGRACASRSTSRCSPVDVPPEALLDVEGAPALVGATAQRLIQSGLRPGQSRDLEVVRVRSDRSVTSLKGRCIWVGGRDWRLLLPLESTGFSVRPDGAVAGVEAAALLVE